MISLSWLLVLLAVALYLLKVRALRYAYLNKYIKEYADIEITPSIAQRIIYNLLNYDSPFVYNKALEIALFKTYAIPTISKTLAAAGPLLQNADVRAESTSIIVREMISADLNSERPTLAVARLNYIHSQYKPQIRNDDMLYTLAMFILEPLKWIDQYEWRKLHPIEIQANFVLWKSVGQRMGITDIPETLPELQDWVKQFELERMGYTEKGRQIADATIEVLLQPLPKALKPFGRNAVAAMLDDKIRDAFRYRKPPTWMVVLIQVGFTLRRFFIRYLCLPRGHPKERLQRKASNGRYHLASFLFVPLYMKSDIATRLWCRLLGLDGPGAKWHDEGYVIEDLGTEKLRQKGQEEVRKQAQQMRACPFG